MSFTELPKHWKWVKLEEVSSLITKGASPKWQGINYVEDSSQVLFVTSENVREGYLNNSEPKHLELAFNEKQKRSILQKGDVLLNIVGASIGRAAIFNLQALANINQAVSLIRLRPDADQKFVCHYLNSNGAKRYYNLNKVDFARANLSLGDVSNIPVPLPPLSEQQRIVAKLEELFSELDAGLACLKTAAQQLKTYRQAVLKWAFEGKLTNDSVIEGELPAGWKWMRLGEIADKIFDGPFGSHLKSSDYVEAGVRVIRLENIGVLQFKDEYKTFVTEEKYASISKHTVSKGDIIFSSFIADEVRVTTLPEFVDRAINKADCFCVRTSQKNIDRRFLCYFLSTKAMYNQLVNEVHGATRPRINTTQLKSSLVPLCSLEDQHRIVQEIESRLSVCDKLEETLAASLRQAEALRQSILKQAFAGKLVAPEESDKLKLVAGSRNTPLAETSTN